MVSPFRKRQAQAEVDRRRNERETYTVPILAKPGKATLEGELAQTAQDTADVKVFLREFYQQIYKKEYREDVLEKKLLKEFPDDLGMFYKKLVQDEEVIPYEDFWQRYLYRCDVDRVLKEWEKRPKTGRQARAAALKAGSTKSPSLLGPSSDAAKDTKDDETIQTQQAPPDLGSESSTSSSSSTTANSTQQSPPKFNSRADSLLGSGGTSKRESISERFNRLGDSSAASNGSRMSHRTPLRNMSGTRATTRPPPSSTPVQTQQEKRQTDDLTKEEHHQTSSSSSSGGVTSSVVGKKTLLHLIAGLIGMAIACDYLRRLGVGEAVCASSLVTTWISTLSGGALHAVCGDGSHHAVTLVDNAPKLGLQGAGGWNRAANNEKYRGGSNGYNYGDGDHNNGQGSSGNPLMNAWRKVAEQTVQQQAQQGQYGGNNGGVSLSSADNNNGGSPENPEGIVGYFKDKFGRAGVVVEQHVVHHHVHHVVHESR